jgi:CO dehydrogenase/acetyl-CoA synthase delta subunit
VQGQNYGQYDANRGFDYGTFQDYNAGQFAGLQYNNQLTQNQDALRYGLLTDDYTRDAERKAMNYGMIGDIANLGMTGRQNLGTAAGDYWGSQADIGIGTANAYAAAQAAKSQNSGIINMLLGK